jgi:hypothetical protein
MAETIRLNFAFADPEPKVDYVRISSSSDVLELTDEIKKRRPESFGHFADLLILKVRDPMQRV